MCVAWVKLKHRDEEGQLVLRRGKDSVPRKAQRGKCLVQAAWVQRMMRQKVGRGFRWKRRKEVKGANSLVVGKPGRLLALTLLAHLQHHRVCQGDR